MLGYDYGDGNDGDDGDGNDGDDGDGNDGDGDEGNNGDGDAKMMVMVMKMMIFMIMVLFALHWLAQKSMGTRRVSSSSTEFFSQLESRRLCQDLIRRMMKCTSG